MGSDAAGVRKRSDEQLVLILLGQQARIEELEASITSLTALVDAMDARCGDRHDTDPSELGEASIMNLAADVARNRVLTGRSLYSVEERPTWSYRLLRDHDAAALAATDITPPSIAPEREELTTVRPVGAGR